MKQRFLSLLVIVLSAAVALPVWAEGRHEGRGEMRGERHEMRGMERHEMHGWGGERDIRHFDNHHLSIWRGGAWHHGTHEGRLGWWWVTAGIWYFYPFPIYPYPDPYLPPVVVVQPLPAPESVTPPMQPPAQSWYYCETSRSYYPYVSSCPEGWKTVPATPRGTPSP